MAVFFNRMDESHEMTTFDNKYELKGPNKKKLKLKVLEWQLTKL